jgi:hypothetical protein
LFLQEQIKDIIIISTSKACAETCRKTVFRANSASKMAEQGWEQGEQSPTDL